MIVWYYGEQAGYHKVGRRGIRLLPGPNTVPSDVGRKLIEMGLAEAGDEFGDAPAHPGDPLELVIDRIKEIENGPPSRSTDDPVEFGEVPLDEAEPSDEEEK